MSKILIIDDQACIRDLMAETLRADGYEVQALGDTPSVKELLTSVQPDVVLLDLYLDGPEGFALLRYIKRQHPDLPVIIVTAYDTYIDDPSLDGADGYVLKKIEFWDELKGIIFQVLGRKQTARATAEKEMTTSNSWETQAGNAVVCPHAA